MTDTLSADLLEITLRNLRDHLLRLEADKAELECRIVELRANIRRLEERKPDDVPAASVEEPRQRRPRGENLRLVRELLAHDPEAAFTMQDIALKTGVHLSSVQAVLKQEDAGFKKTLDGKWQLAEAVATAGAGKSR